MNKKRNHRILLEIYEVNSDIRISKLLEYIVDAITNWDGCSHPEKAVFANAFGKVRVTNIPSYSRKESK